MHAILKFSGLIAMLAYHTGSLPVFFNATTGLISLCSLP